MNNWIETLSLLFWLILGVATLSACGRGGPQDPTFAPFVEAYNAHYGVDAGWVGMALEDRAEEFMGPTTMGQCRVDGTVIIRRSWWESPYITDISRQALVFHELDHCAREIPHDDRVEDGCAVTYMHSTLPFGMCLERVFEALGIELVDTGV